MIKKCIPVWICFVIIISSCNSNKKNPGNTTSGDSTVIDTNVITRIDVQNKGVQTKDNPPTDKTKSTQPSTSSWKTTSELITGTIKVSLKIDGAMTDANEGKITIRPNTDFSDILIACSQGRLDFKPGWHGLGNYDKASGEWDDKGGMAQYVNDYKAPGKMTVTEWSDGKVAGTFSVTVIEINAIEKPKQKVIEGEFSYLHD